MSRLKPDTAWRRIVMDTRQPAKATPKPRAPQSVKD